jgi:hypothetical protein
MKLKAKVTSCLLGSADAAMQKFLSNGKDLGKLCKKEICAISFRYFGLQLKEFGTKGTLVSSLQGLITSQPDVLPAQISSAGAEVNGQAEMAAAEIGSDNDSEVESDGRFSSELKAEIGNRNKPQIDISTLDIDIFDHLEAHTKNAIAKANSDDNDLKGKGNGVLSQ